MSEHKPVPGELVQLVRSHGGETSVEGRVASGPDDQAYRSGIRFTELTSQHEVAIVRFIHMQQALRRQQTII